MRARRRQRWAGALGLVCCASLQAAQDPAEEPADLLDVLLQNGAITPAQHALLSDRAEPVDEARVQDEGVDVSLTRRGLGLRSRDGLFSMSIGGRLHLEASAHQGSLPSGSDATNGTELRRARIAVRGRVHGDFAYLAEVDFADDEVAVKDFFGEYRGIERTSFSAGHQKQPLSLSLEMSSNDLPFLERSVDNDIVVPFLDRAIGFRAQTHTEHFFVAGGVFGESVGANKVDDEGWGVVARGVFAPIIEEDRVLHIGGGAAYRHLGSMDDPFRLRSETTHLSNLFVTDTGEFMDLDVASVFGVEMAGAAGPWSFLGEYHKVFLNRGGGLDASADGWYFIAAYTLTGQSRAEAYRLDAGEFKRLPVPEEDCVENGGCGAWELATRLAQVDVDHRNLGGGRQTVGSLGLNWMLNPNVRLMSEWSRVLGTDRGTPLRRAAEGLNFFQFRFQLTF